MKIDIDKELQDTVTTVAAMAGAAIVAFLSDDPSVRIIALTGILGLGGYKVIKNR